MPKIVLQSRLWPQKVVFWVFSLVRVMCGQNLNSHRILVVKPVCLPIFCCRIFILFAIWGSKSWFKAVCDQKSFILCWYRTRITLNNRVMWTVLDRSLPVSIASRFPPGPLEAEWPIPSCIPSTYHRSIHPSIHTSLSMHECMHRHYVSVSLLSIMLWVAGGNCVPKRVIVKRIRCDRHRAEAN